jgi:hypothetical protein
MAKRYKKRKKKMKKSDGDYPEPLNFDYHTIPFLAFHEKLNQESIKYPHKLREEYWKVIPEGRYNTTISRELLLNYYQLLENEIKKIIEKHSISYWLHAYRRIGPFPIGTDTQEMTIFFVRATLEAAFQKYGLHKPCSGIGITSEINENEILNGILMESQYDRIREYLLKFPQMVLTNFSLENLRELYDLENIAYEIWRCGAQLRSIGKGAELIVKYSDDELYGEFRSIELDFLISSFDERHKNNSGVQYCSTRRGTIDENIFENKDGFLGLAHYNVTHVSHTKLFEKYFKQKLKFDYMPNFYWIPYNLNSYYEMNKPYAEKFFEKYSVHFNYVLLIVGALWLRVMDIWFRQRKNFLIRYYYKAYEGPFEKAKFIKDLQPYFESAVDYYQLDINSLNEEKIDLAIKFWELNEENISDIDIFFQSFHKIFIPYNEKRFFIDYAWIYRRFYDLFIGIGLDDENFKGDKLEDIVQKEDQPLPKKQCYAYNSSSKQIDASFHIDDLLIIAECKAIGESFGLERGDFAALDFRKQKIDSAIKQVDEKAIWLSENITGRNYDVSQFKRIIPVVITPFTEFIPSREFKYWLTETIPRILTPFEYKSMIEDQKFSHVKYNVVKIK